MKKKIKPTFENYLDQSHWRVFATKATTESNSRTEGSVRTVKIVLLDKHYDFDTDTHEPTVELETYIVNQYGNNKKHWRNILKYLDDDCVVELGSICGQIGITARDDSIKKNRNKLPLIDADTPFQVLDVHATDDYGNNVIMDQLDQIRKLANSMALA